MLAPIDAADRRIWLVNPNRSSVGNALVTRYAARVTLCALCHTSRLRKSFIWILLGLRAGMITDGNPWLSAFGHAKGAVGFGPSALGQPPITVRPQNQVLLFVRHRRLVRVLS